MSRTVYCSPAVQQEIYGFTFILPYASKLAYTVLFPQAGKPRPASAEQKAGANADLRPVTANAERLETTVPFCILGSIPIVAHASLKHR